MQWLQSPRADVSNRQVLSSGGTWQLTLSSSTVFDWFVVVPSLSRPSCKVITVSDVDCTSRQNALKSMVVRIFLFVDGD